MNGFFIGKVAFGSLEPALYSLVCLFISASALDTVLYGFNKCKALYIVSQKHEELCHRIHSEMNRGATVLRSYGSYTNEERPTIMVAVKQAEYYKLRKIVQQTDPDAFIIMTSASEIVGEGIDIHHLAKSKQERQDKIYHCLELVGLNREHANRFVHEFSGGQRQRIGIARALAVDPEFMVLDEPISALDVSIQAQVVNLLIDLQKKMGLTYLFVAHDLSMVKHISDRIAVLYLGTLVELATSDELFANPLHPYTQALLSAIPVPDPQVEKEREAKKIRLEGDVPSPINPAPGCRFKGRCRYCTDICQKELPPLKDVGDGHFVACHNIHKMEMGNE